MAFEACNSGRIRTVNEPYNHDVPFNYKPMNELSNPPEIEESKECSVCGIEKHIEDFAYRSGGYVCHLCVGVRCPNCGSDDIKEGVCTENPNDTHDYGCEMCGIVWNTS